MGHEQEKAVGVAMLVLMGLAAFGFISWWWPGGFFALIVLGNANR